MIEWRWKIDSVLLKGNIEKKSGDGYPVRVNITFDYDKRNLGFIARLKYALVKSFTSYRIPLRAINYIWANNAAPGTIASNPFTEYVQMVVVESGNVDHRIAQYLQ